MRILVVYCHPSPQSFTHAALQRVLAGLKANDHEVEVVDLYAEGFDPAIDLDEWNTYMNDPVALADGPLGPYFEQLRRAEGIVLVTPTWQFAMPAMLKGWMDRVFAPGVSFSLPSDEQKIVGSLVRHVKLAAVVTTTGSPWIVMRLAGMPLKTVALRSIRLGYALRCKTIWMCLHSIDTCSQAKRERHLERIERRFARVH